MINRNRNEREKMLTKVRELAFTVHELNLFLDSHPDNRMALKYFRKYNDELKNATTAYEELYGPLTAAAETDCEQWDWIKRPWPWENDSDCEER